MLILALVLGCPSGHIVVVGPGFEAQVLTLVCYGGRTCFQTTEVICNF